VLPRQVLPRQLYLVTRRCAQRRFLLQPDTATNNAFLCLIAAGLRSEIDVLLPRAMSNDHHAVIYDRGERYPEFIEQFPQAPRAQPEGAPREPGTCRATRPAS
jgi:putative transposase